MANRSRNDNRVARHERVRKNVSGTPEVPRLCVYRSSKNIYAQLTAETKRLPSSEARRSVRSQRKQATKW